MRLISGTHPSKAAVPDFPGRFGRRDVYFKMGNRQKAIEYWKKALELEADNISIKSKSEKGEI